MNNTTNIIDDRSISDNPALTSMIYNQLNTRYLEEDLEASLKTQYIDLDNLGINVLSEYSEEIITPEILLDMISYIDDMYVGIEYLQYIGDGDKNTYSISKYIYELFFVDMVNFILPNILKDLNITTKELKFLPEDQLKYNILLTAKKTLEGFSMLRSTDSWNDKQEEQYNKFSYCLDLFDADLELFIENFIIPVCNEYDLSLSDI